MKIFYTASYYGKQKYQKYYDEILKILEKENHEVLSPEKGNYKNILTNELRTKIRDKKHLHYEAIRLGIMWADAVIIETSNQDFQIGHEATIAVQNKKPTLCLSVNEDFSKKIKNKYFYGAKYDTFSAERKIKGFLKKAQQGLLSERFNFYLSPTQQQYLDKTAKELKISKAEVLRRLIEEKQGNLSL